MKLFSFVIVLILAVIACEGDTRNYLSNPNYRDLYYRNQFYNGLSDPNPGPIPTPTADRIGRKVEELHDYSDAEDTEDGILGEKRDLSDDIYNFTPESVKRPNDPTVLRPLLVSLRTLLTQMVKSQNDNKDILNGILAVNNETLAWEMTQATLFYSLISSLVPSY